jgi:predicted NBD/HSP70 family sugar kinase
LYQASLRFRDAFSKELPALTQPVALAVCNLRDSASVLVQVILRHVANIQGDGRDSYGRRDCRARGNAAARATLSRHADRLAHVVNIIDPDVIVLGGGLSQLSHLYEQLPELMGPHIFADRASVVIKSSKWGDTSGVRGAARLWDLRLS